MAKQKSTKASPIQPSKVGAGAAGIGGGSLLVVLAQNLPDSDSRKKWLILCAPAVTTFVSAMWLWACQIIQERKLRKVLLEAQQTIREHIGDSTTSPGHREILRKQLEELQILTVERYREQVRRLGN